MRRQVKGYFEYNTSMTTRHGTTPVKGKVDVFNGHAMTLGVVRQTIINHMLAVHVAELNPLPIMFGVAGDGNEILAYWIGNKGGSLPAIEARTDLTMEQLTRMVMEAEIRQFAQAAERATLHWSLKVGDLYPRATAAMLAVSIVCLRAGVPMDVIRLHLCPRIWEHRFTY